MALQCAEEELSALRVDRAHCEVHNVDVSKRSIWTEASGQDNSRVRPPGEIINSEPSQQSGGGEGPAQPPPTLPQDVAPTSPTQVDKVDAEINDVQKEALPVEQANAVEQSTKPEDVKIDASIATPAQPQADDTSKVQDVKPEPQLNLDQTKDNVDCQNKEAELVKENEEIEKLKTETDVEVIKLSLQESGDEIGTLKARVVNLETELQAALSKPGIVNHEIVETIKQQHEELISRARGMIFDKTKIVKNQELQIEALTTQVQSLKDINTITKDLLEIRNAEVKSLEERLEAMEGRFKAEKDRFTLVLKRAETSSHINDDLRKEYETQLTIFKELREKYEERVQALVAENNRLKESLKGPSG